MKLRSRLVLSAILFVALSATVAIYLHKKFDKPRRNQEKLFELSTVRGLRWRVGDKDFNFARGNDSSPWTPQVNTARLESKIQMISLLVPEPNSLTQSPAQPPAQPDDTEEIEPASGTSFVDDLTTEAVDITVSFASGESWSGQFQNHTFTWSNGPLKSIPIQLSSLQNEGFREGRLAFDSLEWAWCPSPAPYRVDIKIDESSLEFFRDDNEWTLAAQDEDSKYGETTWIDPWLEKNCASEVRAWVDLKMISGQPFLFTLEDGELSVENTSNEVETYMIRESVFQISEDKAAVAPELRQALEDAIERP